MPTPARRCGTAPWPSTPRKLLYLRLRSVGLDKSRVYHIREVTLDRSAFHITFDDGTIAFTEDVDGHVTGAFFEGEGEVLLVPGSQAERASMMLFTGAAILEEKFATGYFRFNDETFAELKPSLRPASNSQEFISQWDSAAQNLAQLDALRLLLSFSNSLPASGNGGLEGATAKPADDDRMLHARLQGHNLGTFDLYFDSLADEQIWAGQLKLVDGQSYYDVWSAFTLGHPGGRSGDAAGAMGEEAKPEAVRVSRYKIRTRVAPPTKLEAEAQLHLEVREGGQRAVLFELSRFLQITKVEADGVTRWNLFTIKHSRALSWRGEATTWWRLFFPSGYAPAKTSTCIWRTEGTCSRKREPDCSTWEPAAPGIRTAGWRWRTSICNSAILRIGRWWQQASDWKARLPMRSRGNNPATGFPIGPCRWLDSTWASTHG